jgi:hypothetical protein
VKWDHDDEVTGQQGQAKIGFDGRRQIDTAPRWLELHRCRPKNSCLQHCS